MGWYIEPSAQSSVVVRRLATLTLPVQKDTIPAYPVLCGQLKDNEIMAAFYQVKAGGDTSEVFQVVESDDEFDAIIIAAMDAGMIWFLAIDEADARNRELEVD
ncbi:MAG TPA: hypothetical protein VGD99_20725 [Anaerolineae bacterium]|jgi:hypothetical protein